MSHRAWSGGRVDFRRGGHAGAADRRHERLRERLQERPTTGRAPHVEPPRSPLDVEFHCRQCGVVQILPGTDAPAAVHCPCSPALWVYGVPAAPEGDTP